MSRTRITLAALLLAAAGAVSVASPALAAVHCPKPGTVVMSDESYVRFLMADPEEQQLILTNPEYAKAWTGCLPPDRVEPNMWGPGYVCLPEGAVQ
ncbi:hypothetical protein ACFYVL_34025 [Streptomyces sp. NPDC004111]|uniref:hypothetical protein n=1 Tax=Streptomyces sp. NPDC004111 TaxID=3364690 RepID=UPI0036B343E7